MENKGTPQTLRDACRDGHLAWLANINPPSESASAIIERHVVDYLSQKFTCALMDNEESEKVLEDLWFHITGRKI